MRYAYLFFSILFLSNIVNAAKNPPGQIDLIELPITVRVDTTDADIKDVYDLIRKFLSTRPDSLYDNPCWDENEKKKYADPYPARELIYQNKNIVHSYPPKVLRIEKEGDYYAAQIIYYREGLEEPYYSSNPWAVQKLYAKKVKIKKEKADSDSTEKEGELKSSESDVTDSGEGEDKKKKDNKEFRLFSPLEIITDSWRKDRIGPIEYHYPRDYNLDRKAARSMTLFCKNLRGKYDLEDVEPIHFYITRSVDELVSILGLDFIMSPPKAFTHTDNAQVFTSLGSEYYPHEITHVYFRDFRPHYLLNEGIATYAGGSLDKSFGDLVDDLAEFFAENDSITFQQILENPTIKGSQTFYYTVGGVLCRMAKRAGGDKAVVELMKSGQSTAELYSQIELVLGIKPEDLTQAIREKVKEFSGKKEDGE